jgi:hypothetical protein
LPFPDSPAIAARGVVCNFFHSDFCVPLIELQMYRAAVSIGRN